MVKDRSYQLLVLRIPVNFKPDTEEHLHEIEELNNISANRICKVKCIKPIYRRTPGQQFAHLALTMWSLKDANILIRDGIYICGVRSYPKKLKIKPKQCMRCRKWGHFTTEWLAEKEACENCANEHRMKDCPSKIKQYCVSCRNNTHTSWDRTCPEFKCQVDQMDESHPENMLTYFPTEEDWTMHTCPSRLELDERFPAKYVVASLPPPAHEEQQVATRPIANKKRS